MALSNEVLLSLPTDILTCLMNLLHVLFQHSVQSFTPLYAPLIVTTPSPHSLFSPYTLSNPVELSSCCSLTFAFLSFRLFVFSPFRLFVFSPFCHFVILSFCLFVSGYPTGQPTTLPTGFTDTGSFVYNTVDTGMTSL